MLSELHLCLRVNLNRYSAAGIFRSFLLLDSPLIYCCFTLKFPARQGYSFRVSAGSGGYCPTAYAFTHCCPCTTVFAPVCLHSAASENFPPDFSFLLLPPYTQGPSFPVPKPRHRNVPVPSDCFQQIKNCWTKEGFSRATRPQLKILHFLFSSCSRALCNIYMLFQQV